MFEDVNFIGSFPAFNKIPQYELPEVCFWGRSNVGKSTMINYILNRKDMAKTSSMPGKTVHFNLFLIDREFIFTDLPGYGYARASKASREKWDDQINRYLEKRSNLECLFLLVDLSIAPQKIDLEVLNKLGEYEIPFVILYTKSDKLTKSAIKAQLKLHSETLAEFWEPLPEYIIANSITRIGKDELMQTIQKIKQ
ncbi:MAG: ribosome biogenesis GTP-binding protein YsxC [Saprospiraceae bacterium]|nr:ribosome biogenesis GTP-binding protein YsxC [Saprospiraceae bacterium]MBK7812220.1 ribosome biogenesis GTP-binding protein YsxC [Saprospiraceae bacterium]MBK9632561.1 ribosome biogenesis GTP-binding protein YsxC [Saprospiraceae bacterium]